MNARKIVNDIYVDDKINDYILNIIFATRHPQEFGIKIEGLLLFGASPRASIAMKIGAQARAFLAGRGYATPNDVRNIVHDVLRHRLRRTYEAEAQDLSADDIIDRIMDAVRAP